MPEHPEFDRFLAESLRDPAVRRAYRRSRVKHAVLDRWRRLVCRVRGHRSILVIDSFDMRDARIVLGGMSMMGNVTASHRECRRCGRRL